MYRRPFKNDVTGVGERKGYPKVVTKGGTGGSGLHANSDITTKNNYV